MKTVIALIALLLSSPALAGPWKALDPVKLPASDTVVTIPVGEKLGKVEKLRFQIDGATVHLASLHLLPPKGDPIPLRIPEMLKSGEGSGLVRIPEQALPIDKLKLAYRITEGRPALITLRLKLD